MARLEIRKFKTVSRMEIADRLTVGRSSRNDVVLRDVRISREHCVIEVIDGAVRVRDLDSQTGTRLNGVPVQDAPLRHRDRISIGPFDLVFRDSEGEFAEQSDESQSPGESAAGVDHSEDSAAPMAGESHAALEESQRQTEEARQLLESQTTQIQSLCAAASEMQSDLQRKTENITLLEREVESLVQRQRNTEATRQTALDKTQRAEQRLANLSAQIRSLDEIAGRIRSVQEQLARLEQEWVLADQALEAGSNDDAAAHQRRQKLSASLDSLSHQREQALVQLHNAVAALRDAAVDAQPRFDHPSPPTETPRPSTQRWWRFGARRHS